MKRVTAIPVVIIAIIALCSLSCSRKEKGRFYSDEYDFSIVFPKTWEIQQQEMGAVVVALSPEEGSGDNFRENVAVTVEAVSQDETLDSYFKLSQQNLKNYSKDYKLLYKNATWLGKKSAYRLVCIYSMGGLKLKMSQYYCLHNNRAYVVTCTALPVTFERYEETFVKIVRSFRFEKK